MYADKVSRSMYMAEILMCEIGMNYRLGEALGMDRHGKVWAVEVPAGTPAALAWGGKYYRGFSTFLAAEEFALKL